MLPNARKAGKNVLQALMYVYIGMLIKFNVSVSCLYGLKTCFRWSETFFKKMAAVDPSMLQWYAAWTVVKMIWYVGS